MATDAFSLDWSNLQGCAKCKPINELGGQSPGASQRPESLTGVGSPLMEVAELVPHTVGRAGAETHPVAKL